MAVSVWLVSALFLAGRAFRLAPTEEEMQALLRGVQIATVPLVLSVMVGAIGVVLVDRENPCENPN